MPEESALSELIGGYFHEDVFDIYPDEFAAAADFAKSDPDLADNLASEVASLVSQLSDEELREHLDRLGNAVEPKPGVTYREWLTQIADRVRAAAAAVETHKTAPGE